MQSHIPMSKPHFGDGLGDREDRDCVGFCLGDCEDQDGCTPNGYEMGTSGHQENGKIELSQATGTRVSRRMIFCGSLGKSKTQSLCNSKEVYQVPVC